MFWVLLVGQGCLSLVGAGVTAVGCMPVVGLVAGLAMACTYFGASCWVGWVGCGLYRWLKRP